jgi:hypothetical protein
LPVLIVLHGARGFNKEFLPFAQAMTGVCTPVLFNMSGHGGRAIPEAFTIPEMASISVPTLTVSGNKDQLVPWEESLKLAYLMPKGQGFTFAGQAHPFEVMPLPFLASIVGGWLKHVSAQCC